MKVFYFHVMKKIYPLILLWIVCASCDSRRTEIVRSVQPEKVKPPEQAVPDGPTPMIFKTAYKSVQEIVSDSVYSNWVQFRDSSSSLTLHFMYSDTLAVSYSPECWLHFPYRLEQNKIVVYWDNYIDTKYDFDIVQAVNKTDPKYIGKPFMILELKNDTTLKAKYLIKSLVKQINRSSKKRIFFTDEYTLLPDIYF